VSDPRRARMTADEFIEWAMGQPETEHYELAGGEIVAMAPERLSRARAKLHITMRLAAAIETRGLNCEAIVHGPAVVIDDSTVYEPDAFVRCGPALDGDVARIADPVIVVEVLSRSTKGRDTSSKLVDYFRIPSVRHYLIARRRSGHHSP
jgi:Uma2 family endonuclease